MKIVLKIQNEYLNNIYYEPDWIFDRWKPETFTCKNIYDKVAKINQSFTISYDENRQYFHFLTTFYLPDLNFDGDTTSTIITN